MRESLAAFGELGLTGRLRTAAQADRRLEECTKLGITSVVAPEGTSAGNGSPRVVGVPTLRRALAAALEPAPAAEGPEAGADGLSERG